MIICRSQSICTTIPNWAVNSCSAIPENCHLFFWTLKVHKSSPQGSHPNQITRVRTFAYYVVMVNFNIILPSTNRSSRWPLPFGFASKIVFALCIHTKQCMCPAHPVLLGLSLLMICGDAYKLWSSQLCSFFRPRWYYDYEVETVSVNNLRIVLIGFLFRNVFAATSHVGWRFTRFSSPCR
jgi:hypothetical protein